MGLKKYLQHFLQGRTDLVCELVPFVLFQMLYVLQQSTNLHLTCFFIPKEIRQSIQCFTSALKLPFALELRQHALMQFRIVLIRGY